jgi:hypothetical protein
MRKIKNILKLETVKERIAFFDNVWKTPEFRRMCHDENSYVGKIKKSYISSVKYYYLMQNKDLERSAFTSWYQVLSLKAPDAKGF